MGNGYCAMYREEGKGLAEQFRNPRPGGGFFEEVRFEGVRPRLCEEIERNLRT